jgi:hypothetical protein
MRLPLLFCLCAALGACSSTPLDAPLSATFGQAVASMRTQIIPSPETEELPQGSAARSAAAIARYQSGEVKPLEAHSTSELKISVAPAGK